MKLRLLRKGRSLYLYCPNGTIKIPTENDLIQMLTAFRQTKRFKGADGYWDRENANMEDATGETLAYIDDQSRLIILNEKAFIDVVKQTTKYVSTTEYAALHGKCRATVKNLCVAGKLPGAYKASSGWLIPEGTPYPKDGRAGRIVKKKE